MSTTTTTTAAATIPVILSKPVMAHGESISQLSFREPTGKDLTASGLPYRLGGDDGSVTIDTPNMAKLMARLGSVPPSTIDQLTAKDWQNSMITVMGFFGEIPQES